MAQATKPVTSDSNHLKRLPLFAFMVGLLTLTTHISGQASEGLVHTPLSPFTFQGIDEAACQNPANAVVKENCLAGTNEWQVRQYDPNFQIYPSHNSVSAGERLDLFVNVPAASFDLHIYRNGYYGGLGGRLVYSQSGIGGTLQPLCVRYEETGLRTCSNWTPSVTIPISEDWTSGIYIARVYRPDTGGENDTLFVVRQDERDSDILYQQSVTTYHAYNNFAGKSAYNYNSSICPTVSDMTRSVEVSFNRPYNQTQFDPNHYYRAEYAMVRWLEQQGYDVTYSTNMDTHRSGKPGAHNELLDHRAFLSIGHDEYWSQQMHDAITSARDAGVHLGFFSGNTAYWRIRFLPDPITGEPDSVMVTYKTTESGPSDPSGIHTGTWRDPSGANDPSNSILGIQYIGDNDLFHFPLRVTAEYAQDGIYRHTGLQELPAGTYVDIGDRVIGWEWDARVENGKTPTGLTVLAETPVFGNLLTDAGDYRNGDLRATQVHATRYTAPSGAIVYNTGTIQWSWGLGAQGRDAIEPDPYIAQITANMLADMDAEPGSPVETLIPDGSDRAAPPLPANQVKRAQDARKPMIRDIQATSSGTTVTLSWETDTETVAQIWMGIDPGHINVEQDVDSFSRYTTRHQYVLEDLDPDRVYFYRVVVVNRNWDFTISPIQNLQTQGVSLPSQLVTILRPAILSAGCWVRDRTIGVDVFGAISVSSILFALWIIFVGRVRPSPWPRPAKASA